MRSALLAFAVVGLAAVALPAAAQTVPPAPVEGFRADVDRLAGTWVGEYRCPETGLRGTLALHLEPGADTIEAVVWMTPPPTDAAPTPAAVPLAVHHVAVEGRTIRGTLARFADPEWGVELEAEFGGALTPDGRLDGHFDVHGTRVDTVVLCGRWWARRADALPSL